MNIKRINSVNLRLGYCILVMLICIISGGYFLSGSKAQNTENTVVPKESNPLPNDSDKSFEKLINIAREKGTVRVIIGLKMDFTPIGDLNPSERGRQQRNIKQVQNDLLDNLAGYNVREVKQFEYIPSLAAEVDTEALEKMRQDPLIASIQEDEAVFPTLAESVSLVGAPAAWTAGFTGSGWAVAVLDTGVDKFHSFLSGKVISEACFSSNVPASNASSVCPGGVTQSTASNSGVNCSLSISGCNHGTHVAGIAAGTSASFSGVARNGNIIAVQVFTRFGNQADCGTATAPCALSYNSDQILGLERVLTLSSSTNIAAVNMSLGGGQYFANCDVEQASKKAAIDNLRSVGVATVISSGNSGFTNSMGAPACISTAVSVGSTGDGSGGWTLNSVASYSNSASFLSLLAPGSLINSSVPGGGFSNFNGTSMAAPHVAGAWAILKQKKPTATVTEVLNAFTSTGLLITDTRNGIVKPRIRVDSALAAISTSCSSSSINIGQTINGNLQSGDCLFTDNSYYDAYTFSGTAGQQIAISMNSSQFNAYLFLYQGTYPGGALVASDNDGGGGTNARIPANSGFLTLPATGTYTILANSLSAGEIGAYSLTLSTAGCATTPIASGQTLNGTLSTTDCIVSGSTRYVDTFTFSGTAGQQIAVSMNSTAFDTYLYLVNSSNLILAENDDGGGGTNSRIPATSGFFTLPATGTYQIWASSFLSSSTGAYSVSLTTGTTSTNRKSFDFDGDNKTDIGIFRPSNGQWWINRSSNGSTFATTFGNSADRIAPADYTGDGKTDIAFFRPSNGTWYVLRSEDSSFYAFAFGTNGDIPAPGYFDTDNKADPTIFRPSTATWYILRSSDNGTTITQFGANGDIPVIGNYDGDNRDDIAIFRPSTGVWWISRSSSSVIAYQFGASTDKPVGGDFTGDGKADAAIWRPSNGFWYVLRSEDLSFYAAPFGANGDIPLSGDYDGDGRSDFAVFRPSNSVWYVNRSTAGNLTQGFGIAGDKPVPSAFVP